ncbi:hypothetical protein [Luteibacter sp. RCC_6_2]|uniref:hypothetical protein n=1 Tax=Luteibacter sp. RCC_6_2 TaxID=3239223 RepID=UPI00352483D5
MIAIDLFPQLKRLACNRPGKRTIAEPEALALYERNWDLVDREAMDEVDYESIAMWTGHGEALRITSHNVYYVKSMLATDKGVVSESASSRRRPSKGVVAAKSSRSRHQGLCLSTT